MIHTLFHEIDIQNKGYIDKKMLNKIFNKYDYEIPESMLKEMLENFGSNKKISYKDFLLHYHNNPYVNV